MLVIFFASNKAEAPDLGGASASQMDALFIKNKVMVSMPLLHRQTKAPRGLIPGPIFDRKTDYFAIHANDYYCSKNY